MKDAAYCVKCRKMTKTTEVQNDVSKNDRKIVRGMCVKCGLKKSRFIRDKVQKGRDFVNSLNAFTGRVKLPWERFSGEMHLPGNNFTGPGTKLNNRLKVDGTPKSWSRLINRVDSAAYRHDLAYARHADTAERIVAEKKMIKELDAIPNTTLKERMKRTVVKPILKTKVNFGV